MLQAKPTAAAHARPRGPPRGQRDGAMPAGRMIAAEITGRGAGKAPWLNAAGVQAFPSSRNQVLGSGRLAHLLLDAAQLAETLGHQ